MAGTTACTKAATTHGEGVGVLDLSLVARSVIAPL
jgi:hypothetical protein